MSNNKKDENSLNILQISARILSAVIEHNAKIQQTNEISNQIQSYIHDLGLELKGYILSHSLNEYEGEVDSYCEQYSHIIIQSIEGIDSIEKTSDKLNTLQNLTNNLIHKINRVYEENMDFYTEHVHPILTAAISLQITIYSELDKRCSDHTGQLFILEKINFFLGKFKRYFEYIYEKSKNRSNNNYMDNSLHAQYSTYRELINQRRTWEHNRYIQWVNLNGNFKFKSTNGVPEFGHFSFDRCTNYSIKEIDDGISVLAVNNKDGKLDNPSILKDVFDIPAKSISKFTVSLKSSIPNRSIKVVIHELANGQIVNNSGENIEIGNEFTEKVITYEKQRDDTILRFEVYWYDKAVNDIYFKHTYIDFTQVEPSVPSVEYAVSLPFPDYVSLRNRSTNMVFYFHADANYSSSVYCAANDVNKKFDSPSLFLDLVMMWASEWAKLNLTFEVYLKTREDFGREVNLCIHELFPLGGGKYDIKNSVWSPNYKLSNEWQLFSLTCDRRHHTHVRCEIYWHDHKEIDIMLRDIKVKFSLK
ncbi:hypothetical protein BA81_04230 [Bacillus safensis FO-36b]|nr:hypothetical protein RS87_09820 [Bacillus safensis FO-36b]KDE29670.1 hypothetical protein BA81_04230 [Bacillus safensis FO-36b]